jgi:hypothetical protein
MIFAGDTNLCLTVRLIERYDQLCIMNLSASINYLWIKSIGIGLSQSAKGFWLKGWGYETKKFAPSAILGSDPTVGYKFSSPIEAMVALHTCVSY